MQGSRPCPKPIAPGSEFQQDPQLLLCPSMGVSTPLARHQALPRGCSLSWITVFQPYLVYFIPYKTKLFLAGSLGLETVLRHTNTRRLSHAHVDSGYSHTDTYTHAHAYFLTHILHAPSALSLAGLFVCLLPLAVSHCGPSSGRDLWLHVSHHLFARHPA